MDKESAINVYTYIKCLHELSLDKCRLLLVNGFISEELDDMINCISSK